MDLGGPRFRAAAASARKGRWSALHDGDRRQSAVARFSAAAQRYGRAEARPSGASSPRSSRALAAGRPLASTKRDAYRATRHGRGMTAAAVSTAQTAPDAIGVAAGRGDRRARVVRALGWAVLVGVVLVPRCYLWGTVPAGMHGDEGGFATLGVRMFAEPEPLWSFGPQTLPNAHFWLFGAAVQMFGVSIWSVRFLVGVFGVLQA